MFYTEDTYYNDYSFVSVNSDLIELASVSDTDYSGSIMAFSYTVTRRCKNGIFELSIGVVDYGDTEGYSKLEIFDADIESG